MTTIFNVPGTVPLNPFSVPIQEILTSSNPSSVPAPDDTVACLVASIANSPDPDNALWQLWNAFFTAVLDSSTTHAFLSILLDAIRGQPPSQTNLVHAGSDADLRLRRHTQSDGLIDWARLPRFSAVWRDVHDILEAWRDWDGVRASGPATDSIPGEYYLRFCTFSASQLRMNRRNGVDISPIWVFYACCDALESESAQPEVSSAHRMSRGWVRALDVHIAAIWLRDGGPQLWTMDHGELRRHWAATLDCKTELWQREDGLTRERWHLWLGRLRSLSLEQSKFDKDTRAAMLEAATVVEDLMKG